MLEREEQTINPKRETEVKKQKIKLDRKNWPLLKLPKIFPISIFGGSALTLMLVILSVTGFSFFLARVHNDLDDAKNDVQFLNLLLTNMSDTIMMIPQKVSKVSPFSFICFYFLKIRQLLNPNSSNIFDS